MLDKLKKYWYAIPTLSLLVILPITYSNCKLKDRYSILAGQSALLKKQAIEIEKRILKDNNNLVDAIRDRDKKLDVRAKEIIKINRGRTDSQAEVERLENIILTEPDSTVIDTTKDKLILTLKLDLADANDMIAKLGVPTFARFNGGESKISFPPNTMTAYLASQILSYRKLYINAGIRLSSEQGRRILLEDQIKLLERKLHWNKMTKSAITVAVIAGVAYIVFGGQK